MQKPEVARKPVIVQQPTALAPFSQIRARGILFPPSDQPPEVTDNRSTAATYCPFLTGTGNRNPDDVTQMSVEAECYNYITLYESLHLHEWLNKYNWKLRDQQATLKQSVTRTHRFAYSCVTTQQNATFRGVGTRDWGL